MIAAVAVLLAATLGQVPVPPSKPPAPVLAPGPETPAPEVAEPEATAPETAAPEPPTAAAVAAETGAAPAIPKPVARPFKAVPVAVPPSESDEPRTAAAAPTTQVEIIARPVARPERRPEPATGAEIPVAPDVEEIGSDAALPVRPVARPTTLGTDRLAIAVSPPEIEDTGAPPALAPLILSPRPVARPARRPVQPALAVTPYNPPNLSGRAGPVCQDPRLTGTNEETILAGNRACGVLNPVKIEEVAGVRLSTPATLNCPTARRFADWLTGIAQPAARSELGSSIRGIWVMGSYVCRTRNHRKGARISEHGKGRAIDVGGVTLADGRRITVKGDWGRSGDAGRFLKTVHGRACGMFHTVLGPRADALHKDHFHFDTAQRGGDPYCR